MKYTVVILFVFRSLMGFAQLKNEEPPFKRFPEIPSFKILLSDSTSWYKKEEIPLNKPVLIMLFSPECSHCQHETEEMIAHKEAFKNIQIIMVTMQPLWEMKDFIVKYKLNEMCNVVVGKDTYYTTPSFFNIHNLPFLAMYDKTGHLITTFEGSLPIEKVIAAFKEKG